jgi:xylan 1,4-beta-xylosidase
MNSSGFDPSLFHDDDGRKWFINMIWDHRHRPHAFAGIVLQEFDPQSGRLFGPRTNIYQGSDLKLTEGPHLYKRNGFYFLLVAEGGTGYRHACTLARSRHISGPYETHPQTHILTSKDTPSAGLQRAGHGDIVDTPDGKTFIVHLASRPTKTERRCILGRETAIQEAYWGDDDWLYVKDGPVPSLSVNLPAARVENLFWMERRYEFNDGLHRDFQWLRTPDTDRIFAFKDGKLILYGRESIGSWFEQALVARRQTHFSYDAETVIDYSPSDERQFAGLTAYYSRYNYFYLTVTAHSDGQRELQVLSSEASWPNGWLTRPLVEPIRIPNEGRVKLALTIRENALQFHYALGGDRPLQEIGPVFDASILSDECGGSPEQESFTGAFVGVACSDLNGTALPATFDHFVYRPVCSPTSM